MKSQVECLPCFIRQAYDAVRLATPDVNVHEHVLRQVMHWVSTVPLNQTPCVLGWRTHRLIREVTGGDPYRKVRTRCNQFALGLLPVLETWVQKASDPLDAAIRLAVAANEVDFGIHGYVDDNQVLAAIDHAIDWRIGNDHLLEFREAVDHARAILYLADNAGELVVDQLLLKQLSAEKVTVVVKGSPVMTEATMEDARMIGMPEWIEVIDNGSDAPGTILDSCSRSFLRRYHSADLIIAKGHAQFETLSGVDGNIYFLLKVKCPVIGREIGHKIDSHVFLHGRRTEDFYVERS